MLKKLGDLMNESHYSCSVLYECRYMAMKMIIYHRTCYVMNIVSEKLLSILTYGSCQLP
jgi:hypothetical protein